jgi:lipopolysaccharide transport system permease protein
MPHSPATDFGFAEATTTTVPRKRAWGLVLKPGSASMHYWADLWRYRELLYFLSWRDTVVRYKQTAIGIAWALLRPAFTMLAFLAFRRLAGMNRGSAPEALLIFAAILPWQFFSSALTESSSSLIANTDLIAKVYFPRLIVPAAAVATSLVDFLVTVGLLAALMFTYGVAPGWQLVAFPFLMLLTFGLSLGIGVFFAALNVEYRDFRYVVPFIVQCGLFVSPIAFTLQNVPERWRMLYSLNPMVGIIEGFRWSILRGGVAVDLDSIALSCVVTASAVSLGVWYFRRMERSFADVI